MSMYLVLDLINDLVHEDGPNGKNGFGPEVRRLRVLENTAEAIARARAAGVPVGYVRIGFSPTYVECPSTSPRFVKAKNAGLFKLGGWGTEVHPMVAPQPGDVDIVKHRVSPFHATALEPILRANGVRRLYVSGVSTNAVVQSAVREGHDRDYEMVLLQDCCAAMTAEEHDMSLKLLESFCTITTSQEVDFAGSY